MSYKIENIVSKNGLVIKTLNFSSLRDHEIQFDQLHQKELASIQKFKSKKRKLEYYYTRILWRSFEISEEILYNSAGRPFLNSGFISISHSKQIVAIAYCPLYNVGVDLEHYSPKINLIKDKFISATDRDKIDFASERDLTLVWSVKEAIYKMESIPGLSFKDNIHVTLTANNNFVAVRKLHYLHHYNFNYFLFDNFVLTYCHEIDFVGETALS